MVRCRDELAGDGLRRVATTPRVSPALIGGLLDKEEAHGVVGGKVTGNIQTRVCRKVQRPILACHTRSRSGKNRKRPIVDLGHREGS